MKLVTKSLPHNFLAEKMILQCLINDNTKIDLTIQILNKNAFYFKNHQHLFLTICKMYENNLFIDIVTLTNFLQTNNLLNQIGGFQTISELNINLPNLSYFEEYLLLVNEKFLRRELIQLGYELIHNAALTTKPIDSILKKVERDIFKLSRPLIINSHDVVNGAQLANRVFMNLKKNFLTKDFLGLPSGFSGLDNLIQGFQNSDLIILAGRPSIGKTALSLNIMLNIIKTKRIPILFFTIEMSCEQIMYRLLTIESEINFQKLKTGELSQNDWIKLNKILRVISKFPLFINDKSNLSINEIRSSIQKIYLEYNSVGLVIIDYLQLIKHSNSQEVNRTQQISQITRSLKLLSREFNLPIIALSQLSRNVETRIDQKPILSDLRESGSIEQDSDLVLMISENKNIVVSESKTQTSTDITIAKHRNGPLGKINLTFNKETLKFL